MTTSEALFRAILDNPESDDPRLVYADYIQEFPERADDVDHAEFIRVQVEIVRLGKPTAENVFEFSEAFLSSLRLAPIFEEKWHSEFGVGVRSSRGFIHSITCTSEDWLRHCDAIYWHQLQTVACPKCSGRGRHPSFVIVDLWVHCGCCDGTGRIPRPFAPTAHPIREVTLTTEPPLSMTHGDGDGFLLMAEDGTWYHTGRWRGITFHLPPAEPEPTIPLTGWQVLRRTNIPQLELPYREPTRVFELVNFVPRYEHARNLLGQRFGPIICTDAAGQRWSCEAILTDAEYNIQERNSHTTLTARSVTNSIPLPP